MGIETFLTLVGLAIAVYQILPRYRQLELTVRFARIDVFLLSALTTFLLIFQLDQLFIDPTSSQFRWQIGEWKITSYSGSFLLLLFIFMYALFRHLTFNLSSRNIGSFLKLVEELNRPDTYPELIALLYEHLPQLTKINQESFLIQKLQKFLSVDTTTPFYSLKKELAPSKRNVTAFVLEATNGIRRKLSRLLILHKDDAGRGVLGMILINKAFITSVMKSRPYFVTRIFDLNIHERVFFVEYFFRQCLQDRFSILYLEIRNNQNLIGRYRYEIPESNKILFSLFRDVTIADRLHAWKPIGDQMLDDLDDLYHNQEKQRYNYPLENFLDETKWDSSLFVGIQFFDIMVLEAIHQNFQWHMWLYYFDAIAEKICRNFKPKVDRVDLESEFPSKYSYLLYEIVTKLRDWIEIVKFLPKDQANTVLKSTPLEHENGNPIKSSIICLGDCIQTIVLTEAIPDRFKRNMIEIVMKLYYELRKDSDRSNYAEVLLENLARGGQHYLGFLLVSIVEQDYGHQHNREHFYFALRELIKQFISWYNYDELKKYLTIEKKNDGFVVYRSGGGKYEI